MSMDDEIINDSDNEAKEPVIKKKKKLKKKLLFQTIFCATSILFIIGCFIFYGTRLIKYYKIYNPTSSNGEKTEFLRTYIQSNSNIVYENEGLYRTSNGFVYKGKNVNNYVKYSNLIWRIVQINSDGTIDIVLDDYINILKWNEKVVDYTDSDINKYLNDKFLNVLNKDLLSKTIVCKDVVDDLNKFSCNDTDVKNYVRLLNVNEFLNSKEEETFISNGKNIWLSNHGTKGTWNINDTNISYSEPTETYLIKPVVTLKNSVPYLSGKGTGDSPYIIEDEKTTLSIGKYVKLGEDVWTIYEEDEKTIKLSLSTLYNNGNEMRSFDLDTNKFNLESTTSLANYLNNEYLNSLAYKDLLIDSTWYTGEYQNSYKDIYKEKVTAKVGLSSIDDLKFNNDITGYYLLNGAPDNKIYLYADFLIDSKPVLSRAIKPSICINKAKIKTGDGTKNNPYILEV